MATGTMAWYGLGIKRAGAMAVTMGSMLFRAMEGRTLTDQQQAFLAFDESSYDAGELDFDLINRPLLPVTPTERVTYAQQVESLTTPTGMEIAGLDAGQIYGTDEDGQPLEPEQPIGIMAEKNNAADTAATRTARGFNAGNPFAGI